jgi:anti-sigma regulatory factor (Ser/Thr protein kinase)
MAKATLKGQEIRRFIVHEVANHPSDLINLTCTRFRISRQAVNRYIQELIKLGVLTAQGNTNQRRYLLLEPRVMQFEIPLNKDLREDDVWRGQVKPILMDLPQIALDIWQYSVTEMVNNAIDHSEGTLLTLQIAKGPMSTTIRVIDNGIGIFKKIKEKWNLDDERHAIFELHKGKLTTDPNRHTGEGIFFTSRIVDDFLILSGEVAFSHEGSKDQDWIIQRRQPENGTVVQMEVDNSHSVGIQSVFEEFASEKNDFGFNKTVVPVRLAESGMDKLMSRSQAKRILSRLDRFSIVIFDFSKVEFIGQAFADEIFRVFKHEHPDIKTYPINTNQNIEQMIKRAQSATSLLNE